MSKTLGAKGFSSVERHSMDRSSKLSSKIRAQARTVQRLAKKEGGWNNNIKPISTFNTKVHPSKRIAFEMI